ncbi:hypothetical protein V5R04_07225 [Jonesiaceae bacterium BS-20]|uniref:DUF1273 family protein n=1 Tax=Jonesiaceae bacterium BS-20 TaxID=3120821 RepID=A0AAU7DZ54_9MICO
MSPNFARVAVTGHRPGSMTADQLSWAGQELHRLAGKLRDHHGTTTAISGMALMADTLWADAALACGLDLWAYIPSLEQPARWSPRQRGYWEMMRRKAAREVIVGRGTSARLFHARNDAMVRDSDLIIAVWNPAVTTGGTAATIKKVQAQGRPYVLVDITERRTGRFGF